MVGTGATSAVSSSSGSPSAGVPFPVWAAGVRSSALASAFRLFRVPDFFLRRRLIVSACGVVHDPRVSEMGG